MRAGKARNPRTQALLAGVAIIHGVAGCSLPARESTARPFDASVFGTEEDRVGVYVRVVDVGEGLCVIGPTRDGHYFAYDGGGADDACLAATREIVQGDTIDLVIISQINAPHITDPPDMIGEFRVGEIWWTGSWRPAVSYRRMAGAIQTALAKGPVVRNLDETPVAPGKQAALGAATVTFVAGWSSWPQEDGLGEEDLRKPASIVVRVEYGDSSLLLTGDILGRLPSGPDDDCRYAEAAMAVAGPGLSAGVMLAPNHGANNASSRCLIAAVGPRYVIFAAGQGEGNPQAAADRYLAAGVTAANLLRTDRGDDEGDQEWARLRAAGCRDWPGDDDIEVLLTHPGPAAGRLLRELNRRGLERPGQGLDPWFNDRRV
jgi:beta-lactamase superfamily II metal-dependent hydrolase